VVLITTLAAILAVRALVVITGKIVIVAAILAVRAIVAIAGEIAIVAAIVASDIPTMSTDIAAFCKMESYLMSSQN
jgi:hypothetical protein